jgi:hypothetical protein
MIIPAMNGNTMPKQVAYSPSDDRKPLVIAVDFDGTLCEDAWPCIGAPKRAMIRLMIERQRMGDKIVLWTCREDESLDFAVQWCTSYGLYFDAANANLPEEQEKWQSNPRKIGADIYIDDKALNPNDIPEWWFD